MDHQSCFARKQSQSSFKLTGARLKRIPEYCCWHGSFADLINQCHHTSSSKKHTLNINIKEGMAYTVISMHLEIFITKAIVSIIKGSDFLLSGVYGCLACLPFFFFLCLFVLEQKMKDSPSCRDWLKGNITGSGGRAARY